MSSVLVDRRDGVAVVTVARPPANALDVATLEEISGAFETIAADNGVTAAVLTGEGGSFSAGLDLKLIQRNDAAEQEALIEALNRAFISVFSCPRYVVAAVNGHAIAGGLILALCCDVRLAADVPLKTGLTEVRVGVPYPVGAIEVVRQELDASVARRLVLGGQLFDASAAVDYGIFDQLVPPAELLEQAVVMARDHPPPVGFSAIKAQLRAPAIARIRDALDGRDPLPRPWLTDETFAAAAAALRGR